MIDFTIEYFKNAFSTPAMIVGQLIGFAATLLALITYSSDERKKIFKTRIISDILWTLSFAFCGTWSGAVTNGVNLVRDVIFSFKKESWRGKWYIPAGVVAVYVVMNVLTWSGWISFMPLIAAVIAVVCLWSSNPLYNKLLYIPPALIWIVYALLTYNIMAFVCNIFYITSISIGLRSSLKQKKAKGSLK